MRLIRRSVCLTFRIGIEQRPCRASLFVVPNTAEQQHLSQTLSMFRSLEARKGQINIGNLLQDTSFSNGHFHLSGPSDSRCLMSDQPRRDDVGSSPRAIANPYTRARPFLPELLDYICETLPHPEIVLRASNGQPQAPDRTLAISCLILSNGTSRYTFHKCLLKSAQGC